MLRFLRELWQLYKVRKQMRDWDTRLTMDCLSQMEDD
jgi:hypothetical protein